MGAESDDVSRLRVGPWVPDPVKRPRSRRRDLGPDTITIGTAGQWTDAPRPVGPEPVDGRGRRRRNLAGPADRSWMVAAAIVMGLGVAVGVPLLAAGHPTRPGLPPVPVVSGAAGAPVLAGSDDASPSPTVSPLPEGSPTPSPRPVPSKTATRAPAPPPPAPRTYEAEDPANELGGTARLEDYPGASGGLIVRNIGNWRGSDDVGWLRFTNVLAPRTGTYVLTLFYVHLDDATSRTAVIGVSGSAPVSITVDGSATCCAAARLQIVLQRGVNTVTITNPDGHAPSIDKIVISGT
jgi:hypothetical protein